MKIGLLQLEGAILTLALAAAVPSSAGQTAAAQVSPPDAHANSAPADSVPPSALLQPALDNLAQTVGSIHIEKWKRGTVREEADANLHSILSDLQATLPGLLKEADSAPSSMSKVLPVSRNVDALYDVVLRVVDGARVAGPAHQVDALMQAMNGLEKARQALAAREIQMAAAQEKRMGDLQVALKSQPAPVCPAATPVESKQASPAPAKKAVRKKSPPKPAPKPAAPAPANSQAAPAAKPNLQ